MRELLSLARLVFVLFVCCGVVYLGIMALAFALAFWL